jgi:ATP/maltotriose-dependent transcriptional regulator MalT
MERLDEGFHQGCRLTLISAPAGYGKTTLLGEWIAQSELRIRVAWVSLDKGDNDPARFWAYVVAALHTVQEDIEGIAQTAFQSPHPSPIESALTSLLNQIADAHGPVVLVLDDYHVINTLAIHEALSFLLENMPPQMHLVISTRADPPLPIPRLRGRGQLIELYPSDLRFTSEEAAEFLNQVMGLALSTEDAAALEKRTEGWITGLQMAAARVLIAGAMHRGPAQEREAGEALRSLGPLLDTLREAGRIGSVINVLILQAMAFRGKAEWIGRCLCWGRHCPWPGQKDMYAPFSMRGPRWPSCYARLYLKA